jgi:hypothetical protein
MVEDKQLESLTTHQKWIESQGIPIVNEFSVPNLKEVEVRAWKRLGAYGAYIVLDGAAGLNDAYILEMHPGSSVLPLLNWPTPL